MDLDLTELQMNSITTVKGMGKKNADLNIFGKKIIFLDTVRLKIKTTVHKHFTLPDKFLWLGNSETTLLV